MGEGLGMGGSIPHSVSTGLLSCFVWLAIPWGAGRQEMGWGGGGGLC